MSIKLKEYPIVAVIWEDHSKFTERELPPTEDISEYIRPSLTLGLLFKKTKRYIIIVQHLDRYEDVDEADFMIIYKSTILGIKEYGTIEIDEIKKGD